MSSIFSYILTTIEAWIGTIVGWLMGVPGAVFDLAKTTTLHFWLWVAGQLPSALGGPLSNALSFLGGPVPSKMVAVGLWFTSPIIPASVLVAGAGWMFTWFMICVAVKFVFWLVSFIAGAGGGG